MKKIFLSLLIITASIDTQAQRYLGVSTSNYNALSSMYLNPANLAGCNEKLAINLFSFNAGVDNSLGTISSVKDILKISSSGDSAAPNLFKFGTSSKFSMMLPAIDVRGPSVLYRIDKNNTVALTTRFRAFNEFNNFDRTLYNAITDSNFANQSAINVNAKNFNWTAHIWSEIGLSYGRVIVEEGNYRMKAGVTLRYLMGVGYLGIKGRNMDIAYVMGSDSFKATNTDIEYASNIKSLEDGFSNGYTNNLFGGSSSGKGFGADIGGVFEYHPDDQEDYKVAVSAAITDLGFITYKTSYDVTVSGNGYLSGQGLAENVKNYSDLRKYAATKGYFIDTGTKAKKVYLPTAMMLAADYKVMNRVYVNAAFLGNLASDNNFGSKLYTQFTVTPRFDSRVISVGMPITFNGLTHNMRFGLGARLYAFYIGSDDMLAFFSHSQYGINVYGGLMVPIYKKPKKTVVN